MNRSKKKLLLAEEAARETIRAFSAMKEARLQGPFLYQVCFVCGAYMPLDHPRCDEWAEEHGNRHSFPCYFYTTTPELHGNFETRPVLSDLEMLAWVASMDEE